MQPTSSSRNVTINQLCVHDITSKVNFLIDTGADISVLPKTYASKTATRSSKFLYAANGSTISTFGDKRLQLNFGLRRSFFWTFIIADVKQPIIGSDFLSHYNLLVDVANNKLIDNITSLETRGITTNIGSISIKTYNINHPFASLLNEFHDITLFKNKTTAPNVEITHQIETKGHPVNSKPRRLSPDKFKAAKAEFEELMRKGICRPSNSNWSSPLHMVRKKDGSWRPCGDFRALNAITTPDRYPLPYINDCGHILYEKNIFSKIDLQKAFHQVPIDPADVHKTAIITPFGLFEFLYMTFGLCNAAQTFQRFIAQVLRGLDFVFYYIDDILVASKNLEEHSNHLRQVFQRLREYNLCINPSKCEFATSTIKFLGHQISPGYIQPLPEKAIQ